MTVWMNGNASCVGLGVVSVCVSVCSAGEPGISGWRFQARSAMKAQLREEIAASPAGHRQPALIY